MSPSRYQHNPHEIGARQSSVRVYQKNTERTAQSMAIAQGSQPQHCPGGRYDMHMHSLAASTSSISDSLADIDRGSRIPYRYRSEFSTPVLGPIPIPVQGRLSYNSDLGGAGTRMPVTRSTSILAQGSQNQYQYHRSSSDGYHAISRGTSWVPYTVPRVPPVQDEHEHESISTPAPITHAPSNGDGDGAASLPQADPREPSISASHSEAWTSQRVDTVPPPAKVVARTPARKLCAFVRRLLNGLKRFFRARQSMQPASEPTTATTATTATWTPAYRTPHPTLDYSSNPSIGPSNPMFYRRLTMAMPSTTTDISTDDANHMHDDTLDRLQYLSNPSIGPSNSMFYRRLTMTMPSTDSD
ncbi:hypothetical protein CVT24_005849 [Panaeolus cyanescens]|uniref:Uncharacterized protein n=1 Tax=Panaeolus cyanescens TaxID=181874 RepID=A0A409YF30_9AGAR|nr:hypothetical protein CVT24_005849 [Panaeolus cyanescens]